MAPKLTYPKQEKLKSRKRIEQLFTLGNVVKAYPIRIHYLLSPKEEGQSDIQVGVSVSKKNFKKAPDRNKIKRQLREAYRLQQHTIKSVLPIKDNTTLSMMIIYGTNEMPMTEKLNTKMMNALSKLSTAI